jgi:hypothetical protein
MSSVDLGDEREEEEAVCILQLIIFLPYADDEAEIRENLFSPLCFLFIQKIKLKTKTKHFFSFVLINQTITGCFGLLSVEHRARFTVETRGGRQTGGENRSPWGQSARQSVGGRYHLSDDVRRFDEHLGKLLG